MSNEPMRDPEYCDYEMKHETVSRDQRTTAGTVTLVYCTFSCSIRACQYPDKYCRVKGMAAGGGGL